MIGCEVVLKTRNKLKRGGIDTIIAYIVVMIPLVYVLVFMIATIYHYSVQMSINQTVKETLVMASTYGTPTESMVRGYLKGQLEKVAQSEFKAEFYVRELNDAGEILPPKPAIYDPADSDSDGITITYDGSLNGTSQPLQKGDLLGLQVRSIKPSVLGTVSTFSVFGSYKNDKDLYYTAYREEIIRNEAPGK